MRIWARGGAALLAAGFAGLLSGTLLTWAVPSPVAQPRPGPVLESVTPAQLAAMNVRLDAAVQPLELPQWLSSYGLQLPSGILLGSDAEASVRKSSGGVQSVTERVLAYATVTNRTARVRGPTIVHRLVWALVGTRTAAGSASGLVQVLWLVDARMGRQLSELAVLAPAPASAGSASGP